MVANDFNTSTQEVDADGSPLSSRPFCSTEWVPGQRGYTETLSQKKKKVNSGSLCWEPENTGHQGNLLSKVCLCFNAFCPLFWELCGKKGERETGEWGGRGRKKKTNQSSALTDRTQNQIRWLATLTKTNLSQTRAKQSLGKQKPVKEHIGEMQDGEGEKRSLHLKLTSDTGSEAHRGGPVTSRAQQVSLPPHLQKLCTPAVLGGTNSKALSCQLCATYLCAWLVLCCLQK